MFTNVRELGQNPTNAEVTEYITSLAKEFSVPVDLALQVNWLESRRKQFFDEGFYKGFPMVAMPEKLNSSAVGQFQLTSTGALAWYNGQNPKAMFTYEEVAWDWQKNVLVGMTYLKFMYNGVMANPPTFKPDATAVEKQSLIYEYVYMGFHAGNLTKQDAPTRAYWQKHWNSSKGQ